MESTITRRGGGLQREERREDETSEEDEEYTSESESDPEESYVAYATKYEKDEYDEDYTPQSESDEHEEDDLPECEMEEPEDDIPVRKGKEPDDNGILGDDSEAREVTISPRKMKESERDEIMDINGAGQEAQHASTGNRNQVTISNDLRLVFDELDISEKSRLELAKLGITDLNSLLSKQAALQEENLRPVKKTTQENLANFCLWYADFYESHPQGSPWQEHFDEDTYLDYKKQSTEATRHFGNRGMASAEVQQLYDYMVKHVHDGHDKELAKISDEKLEEVYEYGAARVVASVSPELRAQCQFSCKDYALLFLKEIFGVNDDNSDRKKALLVMGKTQSGKSTVIALMAKVCEQLEVPAYVITKGVQESKDLRKKLDTMLDSGKSEVFAFLNAQKGDNRSSVVLTVAADTANQIQKTARNIKAFRKIKPHGKFVTMIDECDAMYRTSHRGQKMEQALDHVMSFHPAVRLEVSATPIPTMLSLGDMDVRMLQIGSHTTEYSGLEDMKPMQDDEGNDVCLGGGNCAYQSGVDYSHAGGDDLMQNDENPIFPRGDDDVLDLECRQGLDDLPDLEFKFPTCEERSYIPYSDEKQMMLYDDAMSGKSGVLLLDSTASRVSVYDNIFDKAACVQNYYRQHGKDMVVVVCIGRGIYVRRPGFLQGRFTKKTISEVISVLDMEYGLEMPIFVFGYSKMRRCVSYRSKLRVPTHMVLMLGGGYSIESFIQAIGRGTFNGKNSVLKANGHRHVIVLTGQDDFLSAKKYLKWVEEVMKRQNEGYSMSEAIQGVDEKFADNVNWIRHTNRKCGQDRQNKRKLPSNDAFHTPTLQDLEHQLREKKRRLKKHPKVLKVIKTIWEFTEEEGDTYGIDLKLFSVADIRDRYNETYYGQDEAILSSAELKKIFTGLKSDVIIEKADNFESLWKPKSSEVLKELARSDLAELNQEADAILDQEADAIMDQEAEAIVDNPLPEPIAVN